MSTSGSGSCSRSASRSPSHATHATHDGFRSRDGSGGGGGGGYGGGGAGSGPGRRHQNRNRNSRAEPHEAFAGVIPYTSVNGQLFLLVGREAYGRGAGHWTAFCAPLQRDSSAVQTTVDVAVDACFKSTLGLLCDALTLRESLTALAQPLHVPGGGLYYLLPVPFDPRVCRTFQSVRQIVSAVARPDAGVSDLQFLQMDALAWVPLFSDVYHVRFHTHFWADLHRVRRVLGAMSAPVSASAARAGALPLPLPTPSTPMPAPTPPPPHSFFTPSGQPPLPPLPGA